MPQAIHQQLVHFLGDLYSVEEQALAQLISAPEVAGDLALGDDFRIHYAETEVQAELIRERLKAYGESPSAIKDAIMKLGGKGFLLFARLQPETPGRLAAHAYAYEAMEWAGYGILIRFAQDARDQETVEVARTIRAQEGAMMQRLERGLDAAEAASHRDLPPEKINLDKHLAEAHALESQGIQLLSKSKEIAGDPLLTEVCRQNLEDSSKHADLLEKRLSARGGTCSRFKDAVLGLGGLNWDYFFRPSRIHRPSWRPSRTPTSTSRSQATSS